MNDLIKYGAIGIGAYFLLVKLGIVGNPLDTTVQDASKDVSSPQANDPTNTSALANQAATKNAVFSLMIARQQDPNKLYSVDLWNYFYRTARGVTNAPAPEDLFPGIDRNRLYSWDEYWAAMSGKGFSGMGTIIRTNPYTNPFSRQFGDNIAPTGMEKYVVRFGG